jgi:hypothetical protein
MISNTNMHPIKKGTYPLFHPYHKTNLEEVLVTNLVYVEKEQ